MRPNINRYLKALLLLIYTLVLNACEVDPIEDPNNPNGNTIGLNASIGEIQNLTTGTESAMRDNLANYYDDVSVIGREIYRFSASDPRFTSELLGKGNSILDSNTFYITNPYGARYRAIRNATILIDALTNTKAVITEDQRTAGIAYAKTIQAHELLSVLNLLHDNGIRVDVKDPDKLGPFVSRQQSLDAILNLLDEANADLKDKSADLPFNTLLSFLDPPSRKASDFSKFNRALAARVAVYKEDWAAADVALNESFYSLTGDLKTGVYYRFSIAGNDQLNTVFFPLNSSGEVRVAHPSFVANATAGDQRLSKVSLRTAPETIDGLTSNYDFYVYKTNVDPIPIIRNEELVLLYAEIKAQTGVTAEAVTAINRIRNAAGLSNYSGATDKQSLINEILRQRRYSLYGEGHRWIDMRRYNLLNQLPIDRPGDDVWTQFPIPANEPR
jgi:starch-binding outer membrane protein, SusD/RagB family